MLNPQKPSSRGRLEYRVLAFSVNEIAEFADRLFVEAHRGRLRIAVGVRAMASDLLVLGGGMAGLAAAARAVEMGASVTVVEKRSCLRGSAAMSGGIVWT